MKNILFVSFILVAFISSALAEEGMGYKLPEFKFDQQLHISQGANAGFVDDKQCGSCHQDKYESFKHVGMSKSFKTPAKAHFIEDFSAEPFYHAPSKRYYQIKPSADNSDSLIFERYQLDADGNKINAFTRKIAHLVGSGNKTRSYFYQNDIGELYMLPLSWYRGINAWQMSPGFEKSEHMGISRRVTRECMFCHNALPEVASDSDWHWQQQTFPSKLPQGIGCQRCHGPGGEHIKTVQSGKASLSDIHASIVNPVKLPVEARDSVCLQCHLQPAVGLAGVRNYDKSDYHFRAGDNLKDFFVHVDVDDANVSRDDRFEINHHGYRMRQSECFVKSKGRLTCINCHNPHQKVDKEQRVEHFAKACLACHQKSHPKTAQLKDKKLDDCTACHMPQRRTQDVVHALMTDHKIAKYPVGKRFTTAVVKQEPLLEGVELYFDYPDMNDVDKQLYQVSTMVRAIPTANYVEYLQGMLVQHQPKTLQPYFDLIEGQIALGRFNDSLNTISFVGGKFAKKFDSDKPEDARFRAGIWKLRQWQVRALIGLEQFEPAMKLLSPLLLSHAKVPEHHLYHGIVLEKQGKLTEALAAYRKSCELRANMATCWANIGNILLRLADYKGAMEAYQQVLSISPDLKAMYIRVADAAIKAKLPNTAKRYLRHGIALFGENKAMVELLSKI